MVRGSVGPLIALGGVVATQRSVTGLWRGLLEGYPGSALRGLLLVL